MDTAAETFEASRGRLEALAYRMTGRVSVAEDLVQEAYLRWRRTGAENAQTPKAYLRAVVTRLALDHLKSARARKETYPGPWLPEPRAREAASPEERLGQADAVSTALLAVLETLSPAERAVFVLREAFDVPYDEVAEILGKTPAHCRKIAQRARDAVEAEEPRRQASEAELARLVDAFLAATRAGDLEALGRLLAEDATLYSDGGEEVKRAAKRPIYGRGRIARFMAAIAESAPERLSARRLWVGGGPGALVYEGGHLQSAWSFHVAGGQIQGIYAVLNPKKLGHLPPRSPAA
jgi:RNA polymerase sigma-70 factor (ECF subfamily)